MSKLRRPTIWDVADLAGVSLTTVSDALSGKGRIPDATRDKVQRVARELNYSPSSIARGLRGKSLGLIGISIAPAEAATLSGVWYWASIATHLSETILNEGFAPVLLPHSVATLTRLPIPLDGAIVIDPMDSDEVLAFLRAEKIRAVTIGRDTVDPGWPWVDDDYETGVRDMLNQAMEPGATITAIAVGPDKSYVVDALRGARAWAEQTGSVIDERHCTTLDDGEVDAVVHGARTRGTRLILAQQDRLAVKILMRLRALALRVPEDVRLISISDAPELQNTDPPISSLRQHPAQLAQLATKALFDILRGNGTTNDALLPVELAFRQSAPALDTA